MTSDLPQRYELNLIHDARTLHQVRGRARLHPAGPRASYTTRRVNSVYFDTPALGGLRANLQGLAVRNKPRSRRYDDDLLEVCPVLELKHKSNLLGTKMRSALVAAFDLSRLWSEILAVLRANLPRRGRMLLGQARAPVLLARYQREYYVTSEDAIRVTLDICQQAYDQRLTVRPNYSASLPLEDIVVIEAKADRAQAEQVREVISRFPLPRSRNSKYVNGVLSALL